MSTINSQEEFLQALRDNPAWRDAVRAELLGEVIPQSPTPFQSFLERLDEFIAEQREINRRMEGFVAEQIRLNNNASARLDRIDSDTALLRAHYARTICRESVEAIAMELGLSYVRTLAEADLLRLYREANGSLSPGQRRSFQRADLVIEALDGDVTLYIAGEISYTADHRDSDRALRNARLLKEYTGKEAIPTVLSVRNDFHVESLVESGELTWYEIDRRMLAID